MFWDAECFQFYENINVIEREGCHTGSIVFALLVMFLASIVFLHTLHIYTA